MAGTSPAMDSGEWFNMTGIWVAADRRDLAGVSASQGNSLIPCSDSARSLIFAN
jgi:hypothetical protein